jgi:diguanylate cyclase (GGDEF)-like protein
MAAVNRSTALRLVVLLLVPLVAGVVWLASDAQRRTADRSFHDRVTADRMLLAMLDQQGALRAYLLGSGLEAGRRFEHSQRDFERALALTEDTHSEGDPALLRAVRDDARAWQMAAEQAYEELEPGESVNRGYLGPLDVRFDVFRATLAELQREQAAEREESHARATNISLSIALLLGLGVAGVATLFMRRRQREGERRRRQGRLADMLQVARTEEEAHGMLKRHLENEVTHAQATVLRRNNSANRLEATTPLGAADPLRSGLEGAAPDACLAIRLGRTRESDDPTSALLECEVCGAAGRSTCSPTLVGGEVIGAVNVRHVAPLPAPERAVVAASVTQAAPVLSNLRTLAVAEQRAATDALTGLPNARSARETLKRMVAQAGRSGQDLTIVLFDLDHFKAVNDTFGHSKGDEVLAAVGDAAAAAVRESDLAARIGGEEFVVVLPATPRDGGVEVAEKVRTELAAIRIAGIDRRITASFGVSSFPNEGLEPDALLRTADRALYRAKSEGRDRVCVATKAAASPLPVI